MTYPHRWSARELTIATEYSLRDMHGEGVKYDYACYLIFEFHRCRKSIESACNSKAVCPRLMYLGGVLVLTRIVYYAMNKINLFSAPLHIPHGIIPRHSTRPQAWDRAAQPPPPKKEVPKRKEEDEMTKRATRSSEREVKKAATRLPPTTSPSEESKKFEEELARAMDLSQKETKKGDEEEL